MEDFDLIETPDGGRVKVPKSGIIPVEEKSDDLIEQLRKEALLLSPRHGDKLYPLEVLGVYRRVLKQKIISFEIGNPETFIDDRIKDWIYQVDKNRFANRLEREIVQNRITKEIFLLRLNYAYLMEEGEDKINIHRGRTGELLFSDSLDAEGNYTGSLHSAGDLTEEELDEIAKKFYKNKRNIKSTPTGTKQTIRERIIDQLTRMGYVINTNLDDVYYDLNKRNINNIEEGLLARIAYLVFVSEAEETFKIEESQSKIENKIKMFCRHCGSEYYDNPCKMFCSDLCEKMFERFSKR